MLTMLVEIEPHFRRSAQQQLLFETLLVRFALLDRTIGLEDILRGLDDAGSSGGAGASGAADGPGGGAPARREPPAANAPQPRAALEIEGLRVRGTPGSRETAARRQGPGRRGRSWRST